MNLAFIILASLLLAAIAAIIILARRASAAETEKARLEERVRFLESNSDKEDRFKNLAGEILESNSRKLKEQNELQLRELLTPLSNDLDSFRKAVSEAYDKEARERYSLQDRIREMIELNRNIGREARELAEALRGNAKTQGDWGEMILERILEKSGLRRDEHYTIQATTDADGRTLYDDSGRHLRPDVVINYPDDRCVVIDSKVSLTAYIDYANAATEEDAKSAGQRLLVSVRAHIKELANKNYQEYVGDRKTDFVMMFIPNEGAYMAAMNLEPKLWEEAFDSRVVIISPTHLVSAIKLIEQLWRQDDIKRNVMEIADEGGKMYDKFVGFVDAMIAIEKSLNSAQTAYQTAMNRLRDGNGNLIGRAEKMRTLGAKATKRLPSSLLPDPTD